MLAVSDPWIRWAWVRDHGDLIRSRVGEHLQLTVITVALGLVIAIPLGVACFRWKRLYPPVLGVAGVIYTIPSLALLAFLIPITGLTKTTSIIPLVSYTLLILVRNVVAGLQSVPEEVRESATGMGYSPARRLLQIELPLAVPAIMAGVRITTVTTIGLVTVTSLIGQGGLGQLILDGLYRDFRTPLVVGTGLAIALSAAADVGFLGLEKLLTPWAKARR
ncbi:MAG: osmoprotectant transport system permease protein [Actinomycetota bacterium]|jgi:osmoprotectant transport system permease protein|nr:osmoprotectant transport system permease protein [Actinomycetota bacterium]